MLSQRYQLPDAPPALEQRTHVTRQQRQDALKQINDLSAALDSMPVLLTQDGEVICSAGIMTEETSLEHVARTVARLWKDGANRLARELIRFEEEIVEGETERFSFYLYSVHISGAITLTLGWNPSLSLTQLRAEATGVKTALQRIFQA
jgi:hypothetical protein